VCDTETCIGLGESCFNKALIKLDLPAPLGAERINKLPEVATQHLTITNELYINYVRLKQRRFYR
jgi:hypothetical protein